MKKFALQLVVTAILLFGFGQSAFAGERLSVFVSILPQKYFVQQIGLDLVDVSVLVEPGASPHTYEPKPRQMAALSGARLYFAIGVEFEKAWLRRISAANPRMTIVHTDQNIRKIPMLAHHHHPSDSGHHHELEQHHHENDANHHDNGDFDPHIWLSPPLVVQQARTILMALQEADPVHRNVYEANYKRFLDKVYQLDAELRAMFAENKDMQFMVFHPAWGYFAEAYNLRQVTVEVMGKDPKPRELQALIKHARTAGIRIVFVQPQFSTRSAETVSREINGQVVFADPLAGDWFANLKTVSEKFKAALK